MLTEPIFYSGTGAYDFQYLDYLERKYKYDKVWLSEKKNCICVDKQTQSRVCCCQKPYHQ
jgi:hypothetical protein